MSIVHLYLFWPHVCYFPQWRQRQAPAHHTAPAGRTDPRPPPPTHITHIHITVVTMTTRRTRTMLCRKKLAIWERSMSRSILHYSYFMLLHGSGVFISSFFFLLPLTDIWARSRPYSRVRKTRLRLCLREWGKILLPLSPPRLRPWREVDVGWKAKASNRLVAVDSPIPWTQVSSLNRLVCFLDSQDKFNINFEVNTLSLCSVYALPNI